MEIINQLAAPLAQSAQVTRQQSSEKTQQIRREQAVRKNVAAALAEGGGDTFEYQVESAEEITPIHDDQQRQQQQQSRNPQPRRGPRPANADNPEPQPSIDVTA